MNSASVTPVPEVGHHDGTAYISRLTLSHWMSTTVDMQCDTEKTECPLKSSPKNIGGNFNPVSSAEYTGHLIPALKG
jgi:hypothetical protein